MREMAPATKIMKQALAEMEGSEISAQREYRDEGKKAKRTRRALLATSALGTILPLVYFYSVAKGSTVQGEFQASISASVASAAVFASLVKDDISRFIDKLSPNRRRQAYAAATGVGIASFGMIVDQAANAILIPNRTQLLSAFAAGQSISINDLQMPSLIGYIAMPALLAVAGAVTMKMADKAFEGKYAEETRQKVDIVKTGAGLGMVIGGTAAAYQLWTHPSEAGQFYYDQAVKYMTPLGVAGAGVPVVLSGAKGEITRAGKKFSAAFSAEINELKTAFKNLLHVSNDLDPESRGLLVGAGGVVLGTSMALGTVVNNLNQLPSNNYITDTLIASVTLIPAGVAIAADGAKRIAEIKAQRPTNVEATASATYEMK